MYCYNFYKRIINRIAVLKKRTGILCTEKLVYTKYYPHANYYLIGKTSALIKIFQRLHRE